MLYCWQTTDESDSSTYKIKSDLRQAQWGRAWKYSKFEISLIKDQKKKKRKKGKKKEISI